MPEGVQWDWRNKVYKNDRLYELEQWAANNPGRMDASRQAKLDALRDEYERCESCIMAIMSADSLRVFPLEWAGSYASDWGVDPKSVTAVLKRLERREWIKYDFSPAAGGGWLHWYYIEGENKDGQEQRDDSAGDIGGTGERLICAGEIGAEPVRGEASIFGDSQAGRSISVFG